MEFGKAIPTAGVMVKDGDVHMLVNPDFVSSLSDLHNLTKQKFSVGIGIIGDILPNEVRPVGMHDHLRPEIVDPEIIFIFRTVTHALQ